jgi:hypothetical protein
MNILDDEQDGPLTCGRNNDFDERIKDKLPALILDTLYGSPTRSAAWRS